MTPADPAGAEVRALFDTTDAPATGRPGYLGLHWQAVYARDSRRWEVQGIPPGSTVPHTRLPVSHTPARVSQEEVARVVAQLLSDISEDAGSLMAESLMQEGKQR